MKVFITIASVLLFGCLLTQKTFFGATKGYVTSDIPRFWEAIDSLKNSHTTADSITLIQKIYLDRMSKEGQKYLEIRQYTAAEYIRTLRKYPKYFKQLRVKTNRIVSYEAELESTFKKLGSAIPNYETPGVCFAIGCFRGGGTTKKGVILLGSEIALADTAMDFSEFTGNLHQTLSSGINLPELVAHESIHCQQHHAKNRSLLSITLQEGTANYLTALILDKSISQTNSQYGLSHECELWQEFKPSINDTDLSAWLFNTSTIKNRPPDLGYFIGMRISESYYNKQTDKRTAITNLLDRSKYMEVMEQSGYNGNCKTTKP